MITTSGWKPANQCQCNKTIKASQMVREPQALEQKCQNHEQEIADNVRKLALDNILPLHNSMLKEEPELDPSVSLKKLQLSHTTLDDDICGTADEFDQLIKLIPRAVTPLLGMFHIPVTKKLICCGSFVSTYCDMCEYIGCRNCFKTHMNKCCLNHICDKAAVGSLEFFSKYSTRYDLQQLVQNLLPVVKTCVICLGSFKGEFCTKCWVEDDVQLHMDVNMFNMYNMPTVVGRDDDKASDDDEDVIEDLNPSEGLMAAFISKLSALGVKFVSFFKSIGNGIINSSAKMTLLLWCKGVGAIIQDMLDEIPGKKVAIFTVIALFLIVMFRSVIKKLAKVVVGFVLSIIIELFSFLGNLGKKFIKLFQKSNFQFETEDEGSDINLHFAPKVDGVSALLSTMAMFVVGTSGSTVAKDAIRNIAFVKPLTTGLTTAKDGFKYLLEQFPITLQKLLWDNLGIGSVGADVEIGDCCVNLREIAIKLKATPNLAETSPELCLDLIRNHAIITRFLTEDMTWSSAKKSLITGLLKSLDEHLSKAQATLNGIKGRMEPLGLALSGDPGIGKTRLLNALAAKWFYKTNAASRIYYKNLAETFWSGYCGQPMTVIDDFGVFKDSKSDESIIGDILRIIAPGDMCLNTPFGDKGTVRFLSQIVALTTNMDLSMGLSGKLTAPMAFLRRFYHYEARIKEQYKNKDGTLNVEFLNSNHSETELGDFPHLTFHRKIINKVSPQTKGYLMETGEVFTFKELCFIIDVNMENNKKNFAKCQKMDELKEVDARMSDIDIFTEKYKQTRDKKWLEAILALKQQVADRKSVEQWIKDHPMQPHHNITEEALNDLADQIEKGELKDRQLAFEKEQYDIMVQEFDSEESGDSECDEKDEKEFKYDENGVDIEVKVQMLKNNKHHHNKHKVTQPGNHYGKLGRHKKDVKETPEAKAAQAERDRLREEARIECQRLYVLQVEGCDQLADCNRLRLNLDEGDSEEYSDEYCEESYPDDEDQEDRRSDTWFDMVQEFGRESDKSAARNIAEIITSFGLVAVAYASIRFCMRACKGKSVFPQNSRDGGKGGELLRRRTDHLAVARQPRVAVTRGIRTQSALNGSLLKFQKQVGILKSAYGSVYCSIVKGSIVRTVSHFFKSSWKGDYMPEGEPLQLTFPGKSAEVFNFAFNPDDLVISEKSGARVADAAYYNCSILISSQGKDLVPNHGQYSTVHGKRNLGRIAFITPHEVKFSECELTYQVDSSGSPVALVYSSSKNCNSDTYLPGMLEYDVECSDGDCGSLIALENSQDQWTIIGHHIGERRSNKKGLAILLNKDDVELAVAEFKHEVDYVAGEEVSCVIKHMAITPDSKMPNAGECYHPLGRLESAPKGVACKSKLRKSVIHDHVPGSDLYEPAYLGDAKDPRREGNPTDVLLSITRRARCDVLPFNSDELKFSENCLIDQFERLKHPWKLKVYSQEEAINGIAGRANRFPTNGSCGFPSNLENHGMKGKHGLIRQDDDGVWRLYRNETILRYDYYISELKKGNTLLLPFMLCMKDEVLPKAKIYEKLKTRGIKPVDFCFNLLLKQYFGDLIYLMQYHKFDMPFKTGLNMYSPEFDEFWRNMLTVGNTGFDGDIGGQENIMRPEVYRSLAHFVDKCYTIAGERPPTTEERTVRITLLSMLVHYYILLGDKLYRVVFGNPSGNFLTSFLCAYCSALILRCAYFTLAREHEPSMATVFCYNAFVRDALSGDDNLVIRSRKVAHFFTGRNVSRYCAMLNIDYTDANKADVFPPDRNYLELSFLSCTPREAVYHNVPILMAWIKDQSLVKCISYIRTSAGNGDPIIAIIDNANTCLRLCWTSGIERFTKTRQMLINCFLLAGFEKVPLLISYDHCEPSFDKGYLGHDDDEYHEMCIIPQASFSEFIEKASEVVMSPSKWIPSIARGIKLLDPYKIQHVSISKLTMGHEIDLPSSIAKAKLRIRDLTEFNGPAHKWTTLESMKSDGPFVCIKKQDIILVIEGNGRLYALNSVAKYSSLSVEVRMIEESKDQDHLQQDILDFDSVDVHMDNGLSFLNANGSQSGGQPPAEVKSSQGMGEQTYSFSSFAARPQLIKTVVWTPIQPQGDVFFSLPVPFGVVGKTTLDAFNKFLYWNGDVEVTLQIQSNSFQQGKVVLVFAPYCSVDRANVLQLDSLTSISVAPHVQLFAGQSTEVKMNIPYSHFKNYLDTSDNGEDDFNTLGALSLVVFNPLKVGVGASTDYCTINLYASFPRVDFQILRPPPLVGNGVPLSSIRVAKNTSNSKECDYDIVTHGGNLSSLGSNVSDTVNSTVDMVEKVGALGALMADKPNIGTNFQPIVERGMPMLNHSQNVTYCNVMALKPGITADVTTENVGIGVSETSTEYMLTKPSYLNTFVVKTTDPEGTVYAVIPMCPNPKILNAPVNEIVQTTLCGYTAMMAKFWSGGLRLTVEVIATGIHTMRLVVASHYGTTSSQVDQTNIMAQNATILEVGAGKNYFTVDIPWRSNLQYKEVPGGISGTTTDNAGQDMMRYTMGEVSVRLMTGLQSMQSVSTEVDVNLYWSCMEGITLEYPGLTYADCFPVFGRVQPITEQDVKVNLHMMSETDSGPVDMQTEMQKTTIAADDQQGDTKRDYQEKVPDMIDYTKRYYPFAYVPGVAAPVPTKVLSVAAPFVNRGASDAMAGNLAWLGGCFAAWKGDIRMLFRSRDNVLIYSDATERMAVSATIPEFYRPGLNAGCPFEILKAEVGFASVQFPCTIPRKFNILPKLQGEENYHECTSVSIAVDKEDSTVASTGVSILAAAGDNFAFMKMFMVPKLHIVGSYYMHTWNSDPILPQYVEFQHDVAAPAFPFTGASVIEQLDQYTATGLIGDIPDTYRCPVRLLDDAQLVSFGIVSSAPAVRRYAHGQIKFAACDMKDCLLRNLRIPVVQGGTGAPVAFSLDRQFVTPVGTSFHTGAEEAAPSWVLLAGAYLNTSVRSLLTPPAAAPEIIIPSTGLDYKVGKQPDLITVITDAGTGYKGGTLFKWDSSVGTEKSIFDTLQIPFK